VTVAAGKGLTSVLLEVISKTKMQPQMNTDTHRYQNPTACLPLDFIRVHLCLSVVNPAFQDF
jgi:hypothetical protein